MPGVHLGAVEECGHKEKKKDTLQSNGEEKHMSKSLNNRNYNKEDEFCFVFNFYLKTVKHLN